MTCFGGAHFLLARSFRLGLGKNEAVSSGESPLEGSLEESVAEKRPEQLKRCGSQTSSLKSTCAQPATQVSSQCKHFDKTLTISLFLATFYLEAPG